MSTGHFLRLHLPTGTEFLNIDQVKRIKLVEGSGRVIVWFSDNQEWELSGDAANAVLGYVNSALLPPPK